MIMIEVMLKVIGMLIADTDADDGDSYPLSW